MTVQSGADGLETHKPPARWLLRWATVVLPVLFVVLFSYLSHSAWHGYIHHTGPGFIVQTLVLAVAAFLFSSFVFTLITRAEKRALSQHRELLTLNTVAAAASRPMKLEDLLQIAVDGVVEATGVDGGMACILDEKNQELIHAAYKNIPEEALGPLRKVKLEEGRIDTTVVRTGEPVFIKDLSQHPRFRDSGRKPVFQSVLSLPLKSEGKVKGVMALVSRTQRTFDPSQVQFLLTLGGQLAVAIERTQLHEQVASMAVLEERERIAREMHDGMAQMLGYINTQTIAIKKLLSNAQLPEAREELTRMEDIARDLYADVREGILGLRTAATREKGLLPALREYSERYAGTFGLPVEVVACPEVERIKLPPSTEIQVMRIVQEALTNGRKHSKATALRVRFDCADGQLGITVSDNGQGFDLTRLPSRGWPRFGLQTMRERATAVGGTLDIDTAPGRGTRVQVSIPLSQGDN